MGFKKGQSGNPSGRKKGTPNKTTAELRDMIKEILSTSFSKTGINRDLRELSPKQRMDFYIKLLDFIVPKPKSNEDDTTVQGKKTSVVETIIQHMNMSRENNLESK